MLSKPEAHFIKMMFNMVIFAGYWWVVGFLGLNWKNLSRFGFNKIGSRLTLH